MVADGSEPAVRVERGAPSAAELAALIAVLRLRARAGRAGPQPAAASAWVRSVRPGATRAGLPTDRGRHAWRASALPR